MKTTFGGSQIKGSLDYDSTIWKLLKTAIQTEYSRRITALLVHLNREVSMHTAVWQGETLVNWKWSVGAPDLSHRNAANSGPTGPTNTMSLGSEPRRPANQSPVTASLMRVLAQVNVRVPALIFLTNTGEVAEEMEFGQVPGGTGQRIRTSGMLRLAMREAILFPALMGKLQSVGPF